MKRVLIVQAGSTHPRVMAEHGDFPAWFARVLAPWVELRVVRPYEAALPSPSPFHGFVVTGSPLSVTEPVPWMDRTADYLLAAARTRPVLGVCFGHQLLARALGGRVERNPWGREAGTAELALTGEGRRDELFSGLPERFLVQHTHEDHVPAAPPGATVLASSAASPVQAFAAGLIRCVQFHPEMREEHSRALAATRRELLDRCAPGGYAAVTASIRPSPLGEAVLVNWLERLVGAGPGRTRTRASRAADDASTTPSRPPSPPSAPSPSRRGTS